MNRYQATIVLLLCVIAGLLAGGNVIEAFGGGLLLGLTMGAMVGAAFAVDQTPGARLDP